VAAANELLIEKQKQLLDDISRIIEEREKTYQLLLQRLNDALGQEMVKRDETRLYIDTEILFVTNQFQLKPEGVILAEKMGAVFYNLIKEQEREQLDDPHGVQIISIEVIGHADYDGDFVRNRALSSNRSGTFVEQMLSILERNERLLFGRYIKASSMSVYNPVAGTVFQQSVEEKRRNRRIEFIINFSDKDFGYLLENYSNKNGAEK
jgi:outer membrane protein OmpA-like peptidoglycan-associated protein